MEQADEALAGGRTPPSCPSSASFAVLPEADSFLSLSLTFPSRETEVGFSLTLPLPTSHFLPLPLDKTFTSLFPGLPIPATTDDGLMVRVGCSWPLTARPSQGCTSSHMKWEEPAYLSSPQTPASLLASVCFLPPFSEPRAPHLRNASPLTFGQSWVRV